MLLILKTLVQTDLDHIFISLSDQIYNL